MKTREITVAGVNAAGETAVRRADVVLCQECGNQTFVIYYIHGRAGDGSKHKHLQCADCGACYCQGGEQCQA